MDGVQRINSKWFKSSHLLFEDNGPHKPGAKTKQFSIFNTKYVLLGYAKWWGGWRQYVFFPLDSTVLLNHDCCFEISEFLVLVNQLHMERLPYKVRERVMQKAMRERRKQQIAARKNLTNQTEPAKIEI